MINIGKLKDLTGHKINRLTVLKRVENDINNNTRWLCRCDCGNEVIVIGDNLRRGTTKSCGCYNRETLSKARYKHGHSDPSNKTYNSWRAMIQRCDNPKNNRFFAYGGRGIRVCQEWYKFENFLADMGERPNGKSIDRIDVDLDYCKSNCKWSTPKEQANNRRNSKR